MLTSGTVSRRTPLISKSPKIENYSNNHQYLYTNNNENKIGDLTTFIKRKPRKRLRRDSNSSIGLICGKTVSRNSIETDADAQLQTFEGKPQNVNKRRRDDKTNNLTSQLKNIRQLLSSPEWTNALKPPTNWNEKSENQLGEFDVTSKLESECFETAYNSLDNTGSALVNDSNKYSYWQNSTSPNMNWRDENSDLNFSQMNESNDAEIPTSNLSPQDVLQNSRPNRFWDPFAVQSEYVSQFQPTSITNSFFDTDYNYSSNISLSLQVSEVTNHSVGAFQINSVFNFSN